MAKPLKPFLNIVLPIVILLTLSDEHRLGPIPALLLSLVFPLAVGLYDVRTSRTVDVSAIVGVVGVILTAVIGLFTLPPEWLAAKEAAVPVVFALCIVASDFTSWPIVRLLFNQTLHRDRVQLALETNGTTEDYRRLMSRTSWLWATMMTASGIIRYILAIMIVTSEPGTREFNHQLGEMTALRVPIVTIPIGVMMMVLIWFLVRGTSRLTRLPARELIKGGDRIPRFFARS